MTAIPQPNPTRMVSERILSPLQQVARRQWSVLAARGIILTLLAGLTLILVAALLIGLFDYAAAPTAVRIVVSVLVWGSVIAGGVYFLRPAIRKRSLVQTAMDVERRLGSVTHERITSSVELAAETDPRFAGSPDLIRHLIRQAEADAAVVNPERLIPADAVIKLSLLLLPVLGAWLALTLLMPHRILKPVFHLLMPWQSLPAALSDLAVQPGDVALAQGDPLRIAVHVNPRSAADRGRPVQQAVITMVDPAGQSTLQTLSRLGPRDFQFAQENLQKGFRYHVGTEAGESQTYAVTVLPRPSVDQVEVRYEYPKYTGLDPKVDRNKDDGAIDGLAGTNVTVTIHTPTPLTDDSRLAVLDRVQGFKSEPKDLPLKKVGEGQYQAQLTLVNSGEYRARLSNDHRINGSNLANKDDQPRPITVHQDEKPVVAILSPHSELTVPPTDTVPVSFQAADDFGIALVEAMVQVEGAEPRSIPVKLAGQGKDRRNVNDSVKLAVADLLKAAGKPDAHEIRYWLKATDNRDPDPQWSESSKQVLRLEKGAETAASKLDEERAKDLIEAIRKAIEGLDNARPLADQSQWIDRNRSMTGDERARSEDAQGRLEKTANELSKAADEHLADAYADMAAKAKQVAEQPIAQAAEEMGKTLLHAEQSEADERRQDAQAAVKHIDKAKKDLEDLLKKTEDLAKALDAQHKLEELAQLQQQIAEQMAQQQPQQDQQEQKDQQNKDQQEQVAQKTRETVNQTPQLQDPKAVEQARKQAELLKKIEQLRTEQEKQEQQVAKQAELAELQQQAKGIAEKQEELNKKIEQFKKDEKSALEKAKAEPPTRQQQDQIVKDLNAAKLPQANNEQKESARNLEKSAERLEQKAGSDDLKPNSDEQKALDQARKDADKANDLKNQADRAKDAAEQAKDNADAQKDAAQQARKAAEQVDRQAKEVSKQTRKTAEGAKDAKKAANEAAEAAKQAENDAAEHAANQAGEKADKAGEQAQAAEKSADAAQESAKAAEQAADKGDAPEAARQARRAAQQLQEAQEQIAAANKGEMVARQKAQASEAAAQAKQLAKAQAELAEATEGLADAQQKAQEGARPTEQAAGDQRQLAQESAKAAQRAQQLADQAAQQKNPNLAKRAEAAQKALNQAKSAQQQAAQSESAGNPEQAAGAQEKAENALAQAENALRGQTGEMAQANAKGQQGQAEQGQNGQAQQGEKGQGEKGQGQGEQGQGEKGQGQGQGQPGQGQQAHAGPAEPHPGEGPAAPSNQAGQAATPQQAMAQAAQAAQEAVAAQQQAAQGNAAASAQAASALAQAAQALAQATQPGQGQGQGQGSEPGPESAEQGQPAQNSSAKPGKSTDPKSGISAQLAGGSNETPKVVQDLGVTPSDWAKLGPQQKRELMSAAQQGGPPQYQAMIKNYYVRIARMQAQSGAEGGK